MHVAAAPSGEFPITEPASRPVTASRPGEHIFSFGTLLCSLLLVLTAFTMRTRFADPDMWWHLKTGELIWRQHSVPHTDPFSFTAAGQTWLTQEWLSDLAMYAAQHAGGYQGVMLWGLALGALIVIGGYALCRLQFENERIAFLGALGIWFFGTTGFSIRPHLTGYLLLICELAILRVASSRDSRWYFALPPLFAIWINVHSSFMLGMIILCVVTACSWLTLQTRFLICEAANPASRKRLTFAFALSVAALFVNPVGPRLIWYPVDVMLNEHLNLTSVAEWQPASLSDVRAWALLACAGSLMLLPFLTGVAIRLDEAVTAGLGFVLGIQHQRMIFVFGILAMPVLCRLLAGGSKIHAPRRAHMLLNGVLIAIALFAVWAAFPGSNELQAQVTATAPVGAIDFIEHAGLKGPLLNEYVFGGYLIWAEPQMRVFIDGRADVYEPAGVLEAYGRWATLQEDPRDLLDRYGIRLCLLSRDHPMSRVMPLLKGWTTVYADQISVVYAKEN